VNATRATRRSDSWLLVYLRRVELEYDDHDDLDGEAETQRDYMHELRSCKYGSTTQDTESSIIWRRTGYRRERASQRMKGREQEYKSQASSSQPASR
jgi:hypothetical protein